MGDRISGQINQDIAKVVSKAFPNVRSIVAFTTRRSFSGIAKDVLPTTALNNVIYKYTCRCERTYVGKTSQIFHERIKQHVPEKLLNLAPGTMLGDNSIFALAIAVHTLLLFDSCLNCYGSYFQCNSLKNGWLKTFGIFL